MTKEAKELTLEQDANETRARELTCLFAQALKSIQQHEDTDYRKQSGCAALTKTPTIGNEGGLGIRALLQAGQAN